MSTSTAPSASPFRDKALEIKDNLVDMAGMVKDAARAKAGDVTDAATAGFRTGVDQASRARDGVLDYVKDNPAKSLLACLCAGALAGFLISRRR